MIENEKEDVIESLKLVQSMSLKAAVDGDYRTVAGLEVIKNCLWNLWCRGLGVASMWCCYWSGCWW